MIRKWIGPAQYLFIPLIVRNVDGYLSPPPNFQEFVERRVFYDPEPTTNRDLSISSYFVDVSYGRASLNARVSEPVLIDSEPADGNMTLAAIYAQSNSHLYEYLAVVYPANSRGAGEGMGGQVQTQYNPPRTPNRTKGRAQFKFGDADGIWAMEIMHSVTGIGDYYFGVNNPGGYDEMAATHAEHPSAYTKLLAGWLDSESVPFHSGGTKTYALHAIALPHPAPAGRVAAVRVQAPGSNRYLIIEARLRSDRWDRGFSKSDGVSEYLSTTQPGIPAEGVVIYEFSPKSDPWPRYYNVGAFSPLELRAVLATGQTFTHFDSSTTRPLDHVYAAGVGRKRTVTVRSQIAGGLIIDVTTDDGLPADS